MITQQPEVIHLTERAARQIKKLTENTPEHAGKFLRIGVKGGGCSGLSYTLDFDEQKELDLLIEAHGITYLVDKRHAMYLDGTVLDFQEGLDARGFTFENPKATSTCGCGSSFST